MNRYIIDGHNFIHQIPHYLKLLDKDYIQCQKMLTNDLLHYSDTRKIIIILVFDGNPPWDPEDETKLKVIFSGDNRSADDTIIQLCGKFPGGQTTVVTADKYILRGVREADCQTTSPEQFYKLIKSKRQKIPKSILKEKPQYLSPSEVEEWKREMLKEIKKRKED